jgi:hypothetical protein
MGLSLAALPSPSSRAGAGCVVLFLYNTNRISQGGDPSGSTPALVDVGGVHGVDARRLLAQHPDLAQDVLVLQHTPGVIDMSIENGCSKLLVFEIVLSRTRTTRFQRTLYLLLTPAQAVGRGQRMVGQGY